MAQIVMADDGLRFDGRTLETAPLGGAETAFVSLAEAFARRGHEVRVHNNCGAPLVHHGVVWFPLAGDSSDEPDLYVANRGHRLLARFPRARRTVFWIHNPAGYLLKWRYLARLARRRPVVVFSGAYHAATYPAWAPAGGRAVIPYGIGEEFRTVEPALRPPAPVALFTSNPLRSLDWLLDLWRGLIRPRVRGAELRLFSGPVGYGAYGERKLGDMEQVLEKARKMETDGVVVREPLAKRALARELAQARLLLYRGDESETFCLAVGEAQAAGVPAVVGGVGAVAERVRDGVTGAVARDEEAFADAAVRLLTDDGLWRRQHEAALSLQRAWGWDEAAVAFERLLEAGRRAA